MKCRYVAVLGVAIAALGLSGCGSAPVKVDTQALSRVHTVAIVKAPEPTQYTVINKGSLAGAFGAAGGAAIAADAEKDQKGLLGALARNKFSFAEQLTADLQGALKAKGYQTRLVTAKREKPGDMLKEHTSLMGTGVDAVLDVAMLNVGYSTENWMTSPFWRPEARVEVALYARGGTSALYDETFMYGYHNPFMSATNLDAPEQYHFKNKEDMEGAGDKVLVGGLKDAANAIAQAVANKLTK